MLVWCSMSTNQCCCDCLCSTILPVPYAFSRLGVLPGVSVMLVVAFVNDRTCCMLVRKDHEPCANKALMWQTLTAVCMQLCTVHESYTHMTCLAQVFDLFWQLTAMAMCVLCQYLQIRASAATGLYSFEQLAEWAGGKRARVCVSVH